MKKLLVIKIGLVSVIIVCGFHMTTLSQSKREVLTNAKVIELVRLGLDENIVIEKIRQSDCQCDTSTNGLAKLKAARVPNPIIMAMMNSSGYSESALTNNVKLDKNGSNGASLAGPGVSAEDEKLLRQVEEPGIYLAENGKMSVIEPSVFSGSKMSFWKGALTYGIAKSKYKAKVRGGAANLKAKSALPSFYFVFNPAYKDSGATMAGGWWGLPATSPAEFVMVQMTPKKTTREAILGEYGTWTGLETGARDKDVREYKFEKIKPGIYKVIPKTNLAPGEYAFYYAGNVTGLGIAGGKVFDFSVSN